MPPQPIPLTSSAERSPAVQSSELAATQPTARTQRQQRGSARVALSQPEPSTEQVTARPAPGPTVRSTKAAVSSSARVQREQRQRRTQRTAEKEKEAEAEVKGADAEVSGVLPVERADDEVSSRAEQSSVAEGEREEEEEREKAEVSVEKQMEVQEGQRRPSALRSTLREGLPAAGQRVLRPSPSAGAVGRSPPSAPTPGTWLHEMQLLKERRAAETAQRNRQLEEEQEQYRARRAERLRAYEATLGKAEGGEEETTERPTRDTNPIAGNGVAASTPDRPSRRTSNSASTSTSRSTSSSRLPSRTPRTPRAPLLRPSAPPTIRAGPAARARSRGLSQGHAGTASGGGAADAHSAFMESHRALQAKRRVEHQARDELIKQALTGTSSERLLSSLPQRRPPPTAAAASDAAQQRESRVNKSKRRDNGEEEQTEGQQAGGEWKRMKRPTASVTSRTRLPSATSSSVTPPVRKRTAPAAARAGSNGRTAEAAAKRS